MFGLNNYLQRRRRTVRLSGEIIAATKAEAAAVDAVANQPELYSGVQARIAAKQRSLAQTESRQNWFHFSPMVLRVAFASAVMVVLTLATVLLIRQKDGSLPELNLAAIELTPPTPPKELLTESRGNADKSEKQKRTIRRQTAKRNETVSDFIPLTYLAESTAVESGLIVRVRVSRSMLSRMGLPINAEIGDETVLADVAMGDDGLARAIRFVN